MIFARQALLSDGWASDVRISLTNGEIAAISKNVQSAQGDVTVDVLLPAMPNLHSHSFQRAMAGLTEHRASGRESFWTWRDLMYRFVARITPDQVEAIAAQVFVEMLEAGYGSVGEFHYLHHDADGRGYNDPAEMSTRIFAAAAETKIGLTHLPVLYCFGGAGEAPISEGQSRFQNDLDRFAGLLERVDHEAGGLPADAQIGIAPHSLRATSPAVLERAQPLMSNRRVHIHVAEQPREVQEVSSWLGAPPVEWLLENQPVGENWCFVHATHMTERETVGLARSGAVAGLCPITEANLGDGVFDGPAFIGSGGVFGVGSDSNVLIALPEELRTFEYGQRLRDLSRNVLASDAGSVGQNLYEQAAAGGAKALGRNSGRIEVGALADLTAIDASVPSLSALPRERLLDGLIFATSTAPVTDVWSAGRHVVSNGRHFAREPVAARFRKIMGELLEEI